MSLLRRADLKKDFPIFKELYEDEEFKYQWLYYYPLIKSPEADCSELKSFWFEDTDDFIEEYRNYTEERFERDLQLSKIFMIEDGGETVGYVQMFFCGNGVYKLAEWAMFPTSYNLKVRVLNEIKALKLSRYKALEICLLHEPARNFFIQNGFEITSIAGFLKWEK